MALSASTVWEVEQNGVDTNGGGFVTGSSGTDWTQNPSAQYALTNGVTNGTTTIATVSASADMVGNIVYVAGGTGSVSAGWYQIVSQITSTSITVDRSTGLTAGTGVTLNIGGALKSPAIAAANATVLGMLIYVKYSASVYSITSASSNVASGVVTLSSVGVSMIGYNTTRTPVNQDALMPTLQLNVSTATLLNAGAANVSMYANFILDGNSQTTSKATGTGSVCVRCMFKNFTSISNAALFVFCSATTNSASIFVGSSYFCEAYANTATPFSGSAASTMIYACLSYANTGATTDGFVTSSGLSVIACVAYGNGRNGFTFSTSTRYYSVYNNVATGNTGVGYSWPALNNAISVNCAAYSNTGGANTNAALVSIGFITLGADPFVSASGGNFALNTTSGGGAALRAASFPSVFPAGLTASYRDVGAPQHADPATVGMLFIPNLEGI